MDFEMIYKNRNEYKLTPSENKVILYLYNNINNIDDFSITNIANLSYTSTSSINRLVNKLGLTYPGFKFILLTFKNENSQQTSYIKNDMTDETLVKVTNEILNANNIFIIAVGPNKYIANYFSEMLFHFNIHSTILLDHHTISSLDKLVKKNDFVIYISCSGNTSTIYDVAKNIKPLNIKTLLISLNKNSNIGNISTYKIINEDSHFLINGNKRYLQSTQIISIDKILKNIHTLNTMN